MRSAWPLIFAAYVLALGCAPPYRIAPREIHFTPDYAADPYWAKAAPRDAKTVVTTDGDLALPYRKMGRFTVASAGLDTKISTDRLREEAALRGLDAVIYISMLKTSKGGSSNEAVNYFFPPSVHHVVEGVGVLLTEKPGAEAAASAPAQPKPEPPPAVPASPAPAAAAPAPAPAPQPKSEPPPPAPPATAAAPTPAPAQPKPEPPPPAPPAEKPAASPESKHDPLPPADVFTDDHK